MDNNRDEYELPNKLARLDLERMDLDDSVTEATEDKNEVPELNTRVLRKRRSLMPEVIKPSNRRVSMKPRKRIIAENATSKQIEALYLNKKVNTTSQTTLETIFEEPKINNTTETFIGGRKIKRLLTFQLGNQYTKEKIKKRRAKIKKMLGYNRSYLNRKKIPMHVFLNTIECLQLDEPIETESLPPNIQAPNVNT